MAGLPGGTCRLPAPAANTYTIRFGMALHIHMRAKQEHRDRDETEVAVLDALADRHEEGMTVFELRSHVDEDIDSLEEALGELKDDALIEAREEDNRTVILPDEAAVGPAESGDEEPDIFDRIRDRLPF